MNKSKGFLPKSLKGAISSNSHRVKRLCSILLLIVMALSAVGSFAASLTGTAKGNTPVYPEIGAGYSIGTLSEGEPLENLTDMGSGWYKFRFNSLNGAMDAFVLASDVNASAPQVEELTTGGNENALPLDTTNTNQNVNQELPATGNGGSAGSTGGDASASAKVVEAPKARVIITADMQSLPLFDKKDAGSAVLEYLLKDQEVEVASEENEWTRIDTGVNKGYVPTQYLLFKQNNGSFEHRPGYVLDMNVGGGANQEIPVVDTPVIDTREEPSQNAGNNEPGNGNEGNNETPVVDENTSGAGILEVGNRLPEEIPANVEENKEPESTVLQKAKVSIPSGSTLPLYAENSTSSQILVQLTDGVEADVVGDHNEWTRIAISSTESGYVPTQYLLFQQNDGSWASKEGYPNEQVVGTNDNNQPPEDNTGANTEKQQDPIADEPMTEDVRQKAKVSIAEGTTLPLFAAKDTGAQVITQLAGGTEAAVLSDENEWIQIETGAGTGYVPTQYMLFEQADGTWASKEGFPNEQASRAGAGKTEDNAGEDSKLPEDEKTGDGQTATDELKTGDDAVAKKVKVSIAADTVLPLYGTKDAASDALAQLPNGTEATIVTEENEWTQIDTGSAKGYVPTQYLLFEQADGTWASKEGFPNEQATKETGVTTLTADVLDKTARIAGQAVKLSITPNTTVPLYTAADTASVILAQLENGLEMTIVTDAGAWTQVTTGSTTGYVETKHLLFKQTNNTWAGSAVYPNKPGATPTYTKAKVSVTPNTTLPVYKSNKVDSTAILTSLPNGTQVDVLSDNGAWMYILTGSTRGYVKAEDMLFLQSNGSWASKPGYPNNPGTAPTSTKAKVSITPNTSLPVYTGKKIDSTTIAEYLANSTQVTVLGDEGEWTYIDTGKVKGYVRTENMLFLQTNGSWASKPGYPNAFDESPATTKAKVSITPNTSLPVYSGKKVDGTTIVEYLANSTEVTVLKDEGEWTYINTGKVNGYVRTENMLFLQTNGTWASKPGYPNAFDPTKPTSTKAKVSITPNTSQPLYGTRNTSGPVLQYLANGTELTVLADLDAWTQVEIGTVRGYIPTEDLLFQQANGTWVSKPGYPNKPGVIAQLGRVAIPSTMASLKLYQSMSTASTVLGEYTNGYNVAVLKEYNDWTYVDAGNGKVGYFPTTYMEFRQSDGTWVKRNPYDYNYMYVNMPTTSERLELRDRPSYTGSYVMGRYFSGTRVIVLNWGTVWCHVRVESDNQEGYMPTQYLSDKWPPNDPVSQYAVVNNPNPSDWLNLRDRPSTAGRVLGKYYNGTSVRVLEYGTTWCYVEVNGRIGYMMTKFLRFDWNPNPNPNPTPVDGYATVNNPNPRDRLNLRARPTTSSTSLGRYYNGTTVKILEYGTAWCYVEVGGKIGYMMTQYLYFGGVTPPTPVPPVTGYATVNSSQRLNLRAGPSTSTRSLGQYYHGTRVRVLEYGSTWCHVEVNGVIGYMMTRYLSFSGGSIIKPTVGIINLPTGMLWLNLYSFPTENSQSIGQFYNGTAVKITDYGTTWCRVETGGLSGYMQTKYLRVQ